MSLRSDPNSEIVSALLTQLSLIHHSKPIMKLRPHCGRNQIRQIILLTCIHRV